MPLLLHVSNTVFLFFFFLGTKKDGIGDWPHVPSTSLFSQIWKGLQQRCIKLGWQKEMFGLGMASSALNLSTLSFLHFPHGGRFDCPCAGAMLLASPQYAHMKLL